MSKKKYHFECAPSYKEECGDPSYIVNYCENETDGESCVYGKGRHGTPYSNMTKGEPGKPGQLFSHYYMCNWNDDTQKCYLDTNCPCSCKIGPFNVDASDTAGLGDCSKITNSVACNLFYKKESDKIFPCLWKATTGLSGTCEQGKIPCNDWGASDPENYASNTCTMGIGTTSNCTTICKNKISGSTTSGKQLWQKPCELGGYSRYCTCTY